MSIPDTIPDKSWTIARLQSYVERNDIPVLTKRVRKKFILNDINNWVFERAVKNGCIEMVRMLLDRGVDIGVVEGHKYNWAIIVAVENNDVEMVRLLLKDPRVDPTAQHNNPLKNAVEKNNIEIVRLLLNDSRVAVKLDDRGISRDLMGVLWESIRNAQTEMVKLFLADSRVDPSVDNNYAIILACEQLSRTRTRRATAQTDESFVEIIKLLLADSRVNPTDIENYAIRNTAQNGHAEVVKLLLADTRVNPTDINNYAIRYAAENGHTEVVKLLLADARVNPAVENNYAIRGAAGKGHVDVVKLLLANARVNPAAVNNYAIEVAVINSHVDIVRLLLADVRVDPTFEDNKIVKLAVQYSNTLMVQLLLTDARVDPNIVITTVVNSCHWQTSLTGIAETIEYLLHDTRINPYLLNQLFQDDVTVQKIREYEGVLQVFKVRCPLLAYQKYDITDMMSLYQRKIARCYREYRDRPGMRAYSRAKESYYQQPKNGLSTERYVELVQLILGWIPKNHAMLHQIQQILLQDENINRYDLEHYDIAKQISRALYRTDRNTIIQIYQLLHENLVN